MPWWSASSCTSTWRGLSETPLEIDRAIAKRRKGLRPSGAKGARKIVRRRHQAHPLPAASRHGFQHDGVTNRGRNPPDFLVAHVLAERLLGPWHHRRAGVPGNLSGSGLAAHQCDRISRRPDERQAGLVAGLGEVFVLGEEPVPWMDSIGILNPLRRQRCGRCVDSSRAARSVRPATLRRPCERAAPFDRIRNRRRRRPTPCRGTPE